MIARRGNGSWGQLIKRVQKEPTFTGSQESKALLIGLRVSWTILQTMMITYVLIAGKCPDHLTNSQPINVF